MWLHTHALILTCILFVSCVDDVEINNTTIKPQWMETSFPQIPGFQTIFTSGPIVIVDERTIFVSNIQYDGKYEEVHFWIGIRSPESTEINKIPITMNSLESLRTYGGRNTYLTLPADWTVDQIDYFGVSLNETNKEEQKTIRGIPIVYKNDGKSDIDMIPDKEVLRVPKCCGLGEVLIPRNCQKSENPEPFSIPLSILDHNETHIEDQPLNSSMFVVIPYTYRPPCASLMPLENDDNVSLLRNTSLIYSSYSDGVINHGLFCLDFTLYSPNVSIAFICITETPPTKAMMPRLFKVLTIISTFSFAFTAFWFWYVFKVEDVYQKCFIGYAVSMTVMFLLLVVLQHEILSMCNSVGFIFIFFTMWSYQWLLILCLDLYLTVRKFSECTCQSRLYKYLAGSFIVPLLVITISAAPDGLADVPNSFIKSYDDKCNFMGAHDEIFFIPIVLTVLVCIALQVITRFKIKYQEDHNLNDDFSNFKYLWQQRAIICVIMGLYVIVAYIETFFYEYTMTTISLDIICLLQGFLTMLVFCTHHYGTKYCERNVPAVTKQLEYEMEAFNNCHERMKVSDG